LAAGLLVAGCLGSSGVAGADPVPSPSPSPAPAPSGGTGPAPGPAPTPAAAPKTTIDQDGTYAVGTDIVPGVYSTAGPVGNGTCYWKRTANPDGAMIDNALSKKPQVVRIDATDKTFRTSGCQPWQNTPDATPADVPGPIAGAQLQGTLGILNSLLAPNGQHVPGS